MSKITNDGLTRYKMLYSCTHMATVGVKGLKTVITIIIAKGIIKNFEFQRWLVVIEGKTDKRFKLLVREIG